MKNRFFTILITFFVVFSLKINAQVGINTDAPSPGAMLEVKSSNKGFLPPRVSLSGINDNTTISSNTEGVMVYNTNDSGNTATDVKPGYYYWKNNSWNKLLSESFSKQFSQNNELVASSSRTTYSVLPGLDNSFEAPFTGTYQIIVTAYYAVEKPTGGTNIRSRRSNGYSLDSYVYLGANSAGQASIRLLQDNHNVLDEKYISSYGMTFPDGEQFWAHGQSTTIVVNINLIAGTTYNFKVQGREWSRYNSVGPGKFGWKTNLHSGSNGVSNSQYGKMTVNFIR